MPFTGGNKQLVFIKLHLLLSATRSVTILACFSLTLSLSFSILALLSINVNLDFADIAGAG